jgi:hypothetical protein
VEGFECVLILLYHLISCWCSSQRIRKLEFQRKSAISEQKNVRLYDGEFDGRQVVVKEYAGTLGMKKWAIYVTDRGARDWSRLSSVGCSWSRLTIRSMIMYVPIEFSSWPHLRHPLFLSLIRISGNNEDSESRFLVFDSRKFMDTSSFPALAQWLWLRILWQHRNYPWRICSGKQEKIKSARKSNEVVVREKTDSCTREDLLPTNSSAREKPIATISRGRKVVNSKMVTGI